MPKGKSARVRVPRAERQVQVAGLIKSGYLRVRDCAQQMGVTDAMAGHIFKDLAKAGILKKDGRRYVVADPKLLDAFAAGSAKVPAAKKASVKRRGRMETVATKIAAAKTRKRRIKQARKTPAKRGPGLITRTKKIIEFLGGPTSKYGSVLNELLQKKVSS